MANDPLIGARLGDAYEIVRLLSSGGMGNVYEAKHTRLPKRFAVKVVKQELLRDKAIFERFWREAQVASSLGNRHLVQVQDFNYLPDGSPYMVMEFLEGEDLARRLRQRARLPPHEVVALLDGVVDGLSDAHAHGIVHRDIKPENIFIARDEQGRETSKVLDFGASKIRGAARLTTDMTAIGTPWYMSPEQARALPDVDHRTDEYALAVVIYELLTGRTPFEGEDIFAVMRQIVHDPVPPLRQFAPQASAELEGVLARAMSKSPDQRYPHVDAFWEAARRALGAGPMTRAIRLAAKITEPASAAVPGGQPQATPAPLAAEHPSGPGTPAATTAPELAVSEAARRAALWAGLGMLATLVVVGLVWALTRPGLPASVPSAPAPAPQALAPAPTPGPTPTPAPQPVAQPAPQPAQAAQAEASMAKKPAAQPAHKHPKPTEAPPDPEAPGPITDLGK